MSNLVPEKRVDRNGRSVTRWVSPVRALETSAIPSPALPAQKSTVDLGVARREVMKRLHNARLDVHDDVVPFLDNASDKTILTIHESLENRPDETADWEFAWMAVMGVDEQTVQEYVALHPWHTDVVEDIDVAVYMVRGIHVPERNRQPLDTSDTGSMLRNTAILKCLLAISYGEDQLLSERLVDFETPEGASRLSHHLNDDSLVDLVLDHPDRVDELIDMINDRGYEGITMFSELVREQPSPLNKGAL